MNWVAVLKIIQNIKRGFHKNDLPKGNNYKISLYSEKNLMLLQLSTFFVKCLLARLWDIQRLINTLLLCKYFLILRWVELHNVLFSLITPEF